MNEVADGDVQGGAGESGGPPPLQRALDFLVFAPLGLALTVIEDLPGLIDKGRQRVDSDLRNARFLGELVVNQGQREATKLIGRFLNPEHEVSTAHDVEGAPSRATEHPEPTPERHAPPPVPHAAPSTKPAADPADGPIVEAALAGYDTLSASQVVRRLESLGPDELHAVHRHEASHRNRRTIINRAHQLLEGGGVPHTLATPEAPAPPSKDPPA